MDEWNSEKNLDFYNYIFRQWEQNVLDLAPKWVLKPISRDI